MTRYRSRPRKDPLERFFSKVDVPAVFTDETCFEWTAGKSRDGYGQFHVDKNGKRVCARAHRYVWECTHGPIPDGMCVCHKCDNPKCVRIDHLFLGTNVDNVKDRDAKGRAAAGDTHAWRRDPEGMLRKAKSRVYTSGPKGESNPAAKLTAAQVLEIRSDPRPDRVLAPIYGISRSLVGAIRRREVWSHITAADGIGSAA